MKKPEFYDPDQKNYHFHSSHEERMAMHSDRYYQKMKENSLRAKRARRLILANLVIVLIMMLFVSVGLPFLQARVSVEKCRFHISVIQVNHGAGEITGFVKVTNSGSSYAEPIRLEIKYGTQKTAFQIPIPLKGETTGREVRFTIEEGVEEMFLEVQMGESAGSARTPVDRFSFL